VIKTISTSNNCALIVTLMHKFSWLGSPTYCAHIKLTTKTTKRPRTTTKRTRRRSEILK
jgi:hypothetical protein